MACCGLSLKAVLEQRAQEVTDATKELSESQPAEDNPEDGGNKLTVSEQSIHATKCLKYKQPFHYLAQPVNHCQHFLTLVPSRLSLKTWVQFEND